MTFYTFANATSAIPLANLDANFATPITLGNTAVTINGTFTNIGNLTLNNANIASVSSTFPNSFLSNTSVTIGNTAVTLGSTQTTFGNVVLQNANVTSVAATFPNSYLANSTTTIGNTTVTLGSTSSSLGNVTLNLPTVTNYTETLFTATGNTSVSLANGTIQKITTSGSTTVTLPASVSGKSFTILISYAAADALSWAGGTTLKWAGGTTPTATSTTGKIDIFNFYQDGTNTYGSIFGQNY